MATEFLMVSNVAASSVEDLMLDADTGASNTRFIRRPSQVTLAIVANAVGIELTIFSGDRTVVPRSTLDSSGTTGQFPNVNEKAFSFFAAAGEILQVELRETAAVATTDVMAALDVTAIA